MKACFAVFLLCIERFVNFKQVIVSLLMLMFMQFIILFEVIRFAKLFITEFRFPVKAFNQVLAIKLALVSQKLKFINVKIYAGHFEKEAFVTIITL